MLVITAASMSLSVSVVGAFEDRFISFSLYSCNISLSVKPTSNRDRGAKFKEDAGTDLLETFPIEV